MPSPFENPENNYYQLLGDKLLKVSDVFQELRNGAKPEATNDSKLAQYLSENFPLLISDTKYQNYPAILLNPSRLLVTSSELVNPRKNDFDEYAEVDDETPRYIEERDPTHDIYRFTDNLLKRIDDLVFFSQDQPSYEHLIEAASFLGFTLSLYLNTMKDSEISSEKITESTEGVIATINQFFESSISALGENEDISTVGRLPGRNPKIKLYEDFRQSILSKIQRA
jgi:hypothetical protein